MKQREMQRKGDPAWLVEGRCRDDRPVGRKRDAGGGESFEWRAKWEGSGEEQSASGKRVGAARSMDAEMGRVSTQKLSSSAHI